MQDAGYTDLRLRLALPPTMYAHNGAPIIERNLAAVGIAVQAQHLSWEQWMAQVFRGDFDMSLILHVEPRDYRIYARSDYYFGYDSPVFRALVQRHDVSPNPREQLRLFQQIQRHLAEDAVNAWIFNPDISVIHNRRLRGLPMDYPMLTHRLSDYYWA